MVFGVESVKNFTIVEKIEGVGVVDIAVLGCGGSVPLSVPLGVPL